MTLHELISSWASNLTFMDYNTAYGSIVCAGLIGGLCVVAALGGLIAALWGEYDKNIR